MTKTIKLSLAAALLATAASAAPTVGGSLAHQFEAMDDTDAGYTTNTKVTLKATGAVNDNISYAVSYSERITDQYDALGNNDRGLALSNAKFTVKTDVATVIAGRQGLTTPWTNGSSLIDGTQVGNGVLALVPAGPATIVGAHVVTHNIQNVAVGKDSDISILGALGKVEMVNLEAWYASIGEDAHTGPEGLTSIVVAAKAAIEGVNVEARYQSVSPEADAVDTQTLMALTASAKVGDITVNAGYAVSGDDGDLTSLDKDGNAANDVYAGTWNIRMGAGKTAGASLVSIGATMPINDTFTANLNYGMVSGDVTHAKNDESVSEIKGQISANVAKNLSLYARAAIVSSEDDTLDYTRTRLYAAYKF